MIEAETGKILLVDDSWVILEKTKAALVEAGYDVRTSTGTLGALKQVKACDLAVVDFHMPGVDGTTVAQSLRQAAGQPEPCLFYLYTSDAAVAPRYAEYGYDGSFLRKGDERALVPQVEAVFRTIRMRKLAAKMRLQRGR